MAALARSAAFDLDAAIIDALEAADYATSEDVTSSMLRAWSRADKDAALMDLLPLRIEATRKRHLWKSLGKVRQIRVDIADRQRVSSEGSRTIKVVVMDAKDQLIRIPGYGMMRLGDCAQRHIKVKYEDYYQRRDRMDAVGRRFEALHAQMVVKSVAKVDAVSDAVFVETLGMGPVAE